MEAGRRARLWRALGLMVCTALGSASCTTVITSAAPGVGTVVAAESFWGSIASQLGGTRVRTESIVTNPDADPHAYEPTAADARDIATAGVVIVNGIGYDGWVQRLLDANPAPKRTVLNVGDLVGVRTGGNPHQWYSPSSVLRVIDRITDIYKARDAADAAFFDEQRRSFLTGPFSAYTTLIASIRSRYAGTPVGASESIFSPMATALGLNLVTPRAFMKAISEGAEPNAADTTSIDRQIARGELKVYVYNSQNATPDIRRQVAECRARGIPVTTITETLVPAGATFEQWQVAQLTALGSALTQGTGR